MNVKCFNALGNTASPPAEAGLQTLLSLRATRGKSTSAQQTRWQEQERANKSHHRFNDNADYSEWDREQPKERQEHDRDDQQWPAQHPQDATAEHDQ